MILTAKAAENQYVGVACGKLDQSCEVLSKKNHLLYLDTKDDSYELIPTSEKMKPYKVAIFFSGLERSLKNSDNPHLLRSHYNRDQPNSFGHMHFQVQTLFCTIQKRFGNLGLRLFQSCNASLN